ncbi:hypothetical protein AXG93_977s1110 [Marchantia polymorpha subsp. ruderalis]|uniref:Uncharacterized protein n=1 Tax=Marchantia polymorpha subsp. ruderalis TaxID=1480154 RepID=A0A176WBK5_MARPO|nr:hypothetical protein AXG93_977s1110 [Marchantia polymorpha subsp. ruderalis]
MDAAKDRLMRRVTIGVTSLVAALMITADYGSHPHALSAELNTYQKVHNSVSKLDGRDDKAKDCFETFCHTKFTRDNSQVTRWWDAGKEWFLKPSEKELAELEKIRKEFNVRKVTEDDHEGTK